VCMSKRIGFTFSAALALALTVGGFSAWPTRVRAQLPPFVGSTRAPAIDIDRSDVLYLMMSVATAPPSRQTPHSQIFFTSSRDGGLNWDNLPLTRNLTQTPGEAFGPSLAVTKSGTPRAYVTYHDNSSGTTLAYMIHSKKKAKFRGPQNITPAGRTAAFFPRVALDSNEAVNVTWGDTTGGGRQVVFQRSTDQGATFGPLLNLSNSAGFAFYPDIAVDPSDALNVVWEDTGSGQSVIVFSRSVDGGQTFSTPTLVSTGADSAAGARVIADSQGRLSFAWVDTSPDGTAQAFYARSTDHGQTFSTPINISNLKNGQILKPVLASFGDTVYYAFQDEADGDLQVYLAKSSDAGVSFSKPVRVSNADNTRGRAHSAAMAVNSKGVLQIVWIDASIIGHDEGLLFYSNTKDGRAFSPQFEILAGIETPM